MSIASTNHNTFTPHCLLYSSNILAADMSLSCLPNELLVPIFQSVDSISDAAALGRTSRRFHDVYQYNLSSICDVVLPRTIEVYDQAAQLLEARTDPAAISSDDLGTIVEAVMSPSMTPYRMVEDHDREVRLHKARAKPNIISSQSLTNEEPVAAIKRAKKLFADADLVHSALQQFEMGVCLTLVVPPELLVRGSSPTEPPGTASLEPFTRARFLQAYYRGVSLGYLLRRTAGEMYQFLASMSLLDFLCMSEVLGWLLDEYSMSREVPETLLLDGWPSLLNERRSLPGHINSFDPLVADEEHYSWRSTLLTNGWSLVSDLVSDLEKIRGIAGLEKRYFKRGPDAARFFFIFHGDGPNARAEKAKGVAMADVLPLLAAIS